MKYVDLIAALDQRAVVGVLFAFFGLVSLAQRRHKRSRFRRIRRNRASLDRQRRFATWQRRRIHARDGGLCHYCLLLGIETRVHFASDFKGGHACDACFHADHVVPHSLGGPTTVANGITACSYHNQAKGGLTYKEFTGIEFAGVRR